MNFFEELGVSGKELLGDRFDAEGFFDVGQHGIVIRVLQEGEKAGLSGVAAFALANQIREPAGGRELRVDANFAVLVLNGSVFHLHVGEAPLLFGRRDEGDEGSVLFIAHFEMVGDEIPNGGASALEF